MKAKLVSVLCLYLLSNSAGGQTLIYHFKPQPSPIEEQVKELTGDRDDQMTQGAQDVAAVLAAWNPEISQVVVEQILLKRAREKGATEGIVKPALALMDLAMMSDEREAARMLLPAVISFEPLTGKKLIDALGLSSMNWRSIQGLNALNDLRRDTIGKLNQEYGTNVREASRMPGLLKDLRRLDSSGLIAAMLGPGSRIHVLAGLERGDNEMRMHRKSPIYGLGRDDIQQCYAKCEGDAVTHAGTGAVIGAIVGTAVGAAAGGIPTGGIGVAAGADVGYKVGTAGGGIIGFGLGFAHCASKACGSQEARTPMKPTVPSQPKNQPKPAPPPPAPSSPSAPKPNSTDKPKKSPSGGSGGGSAGGSEPCSASSKTCDALVNPDDDRNQGGHAPSDTGPGIRVGKIHERPKLEAWLIPGRAPFVNPVRADLDLKTIQGYRR